MKSPESVIFDSISNSTEVVHTVPSVPEINPRDTDEWAAEMKLQYEKLFYTGQLLDLKELKTIDEKYHKEIALKLIEAKEGNSVAQNLGKFQGLNHKEIALKLIESKKGYTVVENLEKFQGLNHKEIALKLIKIGEGYDVARNLEKFQGLNHTEIALKLIEAKKGYTVVENLGKFQGLNHTEIALKLIEAKEGYDVARNLEKFQGLNHKEIALKLIKIGEGYDVARNLEKFQGLNHKEIALKIIEAKEGYDVARNLEKFQGLNHKEIALKIIEAKQGNIVVNNLSNFTLTIEDKKEIGAVIFPSITTLDNLKKISEQSLLSDTTRLSIPELLFDASGTDLYNKLSQALRKEKVYWGNNTFNKKKILSHSFVFKYFKQYIHFNESGFGNHSDEELKRILDLEDQSVDPLYTVKKIVIPLLDAEKVSEFKWTEDVVNKYRRILESIENAQKKGDEKKVLSQYAKQLQDIITSTIATYKVKLTSTQNEKARENLESKLTNLEAITIRSVKDLEVNMNTLLDIKECQPIILEAVFYMALHKNPTWKTFNSRDAEENISVDNVAKVVEFVDHLTNQETLEAYFPNDHVAKKFDNLLDIRALSGAIRKATDVGTKGTLELEIVPSRGTLMELSGHIADACWASKYDSIAKKYPNFTALIFKQNPGNEKDERLAGACMIIETTTTSGEKLLLIRGLNPIENTINRLYVPDFVKQVVLYVHKIADQKRDGKSKVGIIIDDNRGGSASNRDAVFNYLSTNMKTQEKLIRGISHAETEFNGYNVTNDCYYI